MLHRRDEGTIQLPLYAIDLVLRAHAGKLMVAGSWPLAQIAGDFEPNDIDLFTNDPYIFNSVKVALLETPGIKRILDIKGSTVPSKQSQVILVSFTGTKINLIHSADGPNLAEDVFAGFDLSCCEVGIEWDNEEGTWVLVWSDKFQDWMDTQVIEVNPSVTASKKVYKRFKKYAERFGPKFRVMYGAPGSVAVGQDFDVYPPVLRDENMEGIDIVYKGGPLNGGVNQHVWEKEDQPERTSPDNSEDRSGSAGRRKPVASKLKRHNSTPGRGSIRAIKRAGGSKSGERAVAG